MQPMLHMSIFSSYNGGDGCIDDNDDDDKGDEDVGDLDDDAAASEIEMLPESRPFRSTLLACFSARSSCSSFI